MANDYYDGGRLIRGRHEDDLPLAVQVTGALPPMPDDRCPDCDFYEDECVCDEDYEPEPDYGYRYDAAAARIEEAGRG